jgi:antitoxin MazE
VKTKVQKWGNSLALRIPRALAADAKIEAGSTVEIQWRDGKLTIEPVTEPQYQLEELLAGMNSANIHGEVPSGDRIGREAW